ncbi:MAG: nucleotidyltransferase domain-containing protein [archaeon]
MGKRESMIKKLKEFKSEIMRDLAVKKMFLFGSRANGRPHRWSDVDLVIVSNKFRNISFRKRATKMYDYWYLDYPVDFLCYTSDEFEKKKKQLGIVRQAVKEGIEL